MKAEYYKDGNLVLTEFYNAQFDIIKTHLENGTYTVKVSPAKDNEIYNNESFFNLTVNNQLEVKYNFNLLNHD